jgi:hypothetical protein
LHIPVKISLPGCLYLVEPYPENTVPLLNVYRKKAPAFWLMLSLKFDYRYAAAVKA